MNAFEGIWHEIIIFMFAWQLATLAIEKDINDFA